MERTLIGKAYKRLITRRFLVRIQAEEKSSVAEWQTHRHEQAFQTCTLLGLLRTAIAVKTIKQADPVLAGATVKAAASRDRSPPGLIGVRAPTFEAYKLLEATEEGSDEAGSTPARQKIAALC